MEDAWKQLFIEAILTLMFAFAAWYSLHPELDFKRFELFKTVFPVTTNKASRQISKLFGYLYALIAIMFFLFFIEDLANILRGLP